MRKKIATVTAGAIMVLAGYEGFSQFAESPLPGDKLTIGFGHTENVREGQEITLRDAARLLVQDVRVYEEGVSRCVTADVTQNQFDALVILAYNIGTSAFCKSTLVRKLNIADMAGVEREWMRWKYFQGKPVKGLENRRARELAIFRGEVVTDDGEGITCFGSAGCLSYSDALQERERSPDRAEKN